VFNEVRPGILCAETSSGESELRRSGQNAVIQQEKQMLAMTKTITRIERKRKGERRLQQKSTPAPVIQENKD
jgi:hypothetical protein